MNISTLALVCGGLLAVTMPAGAATITLDSSYSGYLGSIDPHHPADLGGETYYVNFLLGMAPSSTIVVNDTPGLPPNDEHMFVRSSNACGAPCVEAGAGVKITPGNTSSLNLTDWTYLLARYGNTADVWFIGALDSPDVALLPSKGPNQNGLAHYTLFTPARVPDGGATMGLLGVGLLALAYMKRRQRSREATAAGAPFVKPRGRLLDM